jgi:hypothetical protein
MSNDYSMQTSIVEGTHDGFDQFEHHPRDSITPMCKASFSTEHFRDNVMDFNANSLAALKNKRLVTILKEKIFKGFSRLKQKTVMIEEPIIAINSKVWKVSKKGMKKRNSSLKETIRSSCNLATHFLEIKNMGRTVREERYDSDEDARLFITDKPRIMKERLVKLPNEEEKQEMLLKRILNNNIEEGKFYSLLNFRPFEIKRPNANTHYNVNRLRLENEMLSHADDAARTTQSEFLYKISRPQKDNPVDTSKKVNFKTNPGLIRSINKYTMISTKEEDEGDILLSTEDKITKNDNDNHIDRMRKISSMRDKLNKKITQEKSRYHYLKLKEDEINQELENLNFLESELGNINIAARGNYIEKTKPKQNIKLKPLNRTVNNFITGNLKTNIYSNKQTFNQLKDIVLLRENNEKKYDTTRDKNVFKILNNIHK